MFCFWTDVVPLDAALLAVGASASKICCSTASIPSTCKPTWFPRLCPYLQAVMDHPHPRKSTNVSASTACRIRFWATAIQVPNSPAGKEVATAASGARGLAERHPQKRVTWANDLEKIRVFDVSVGMRSPPVQFHMLACLY